MSKDSFDDIAIDFLDDTMQDQSKMHIFAKKLITVDVSLDKNLRKILKVMNNVA
jgi:hypothetical protein